MTNETTEKVQSKWFMEGDKSLLLALGFTWALFAGGCMYGRHSFDTDRMKDSFAKNAMIRDINNDGLVDLCLENKWYLATPNGYVRPNSAYCEETK